MVYDFKKHDYEIYAPFIGKVHGPWIQMGDGCWTWVELFERNKSTALLCALCVREYLKSNTNVYSVFKFIHILRGILKTTKEN